MYVMQDILKYIGKLTNGEHSPNAKTELKDLGFVSCANRVFVKHAPFYQPCLITVLSGRKILFKDSQEVICETGQTLAVPGPSSYDLRNEPDPVNRKYASLIIPFNAELLKSLQSAHNITYSHKKQDINILTFSEYSVLNDSIKHYLSALSSQTLITHRLMEILLVLIEQNPALLSFALLQETWSQQVRTVLATDLTCTWELPDVCDQLSTSESTLRRHLRKEGTNFRELLSELRLSSALMHLLQTTAPVQQIAYECGYQSVSRFSQNFHKRFGLPPDQFRESVNENGYDLNVIEHP